MLIPSASHVQVARHTATALNGKTKTLIRECLRTHGLFNAIYALHPIFLYFDPFRGCLQDVMHDEFSSGTANSELATMLYICISEMVQCRDAECGNLET